MKLKRAKVVMLPTNEKPKVGMINKDKLNTNILELIHYVITGEGLHPQHLYITSDDEIKAADWYLYYCLGINELPELMQCKNNAEANRCNSHHIIDPFCFKITATTDKSLRLSNPKELKFGYDPRSFDLSQPSSDFIVKYIEEYNKGNVIEDILVEYEEADNRNYHAEIDYFGKTDIEVEDDYLKIDKNNCITIKKITLKITHKKETMNKLKMINKFLNELGTVKSKDIVTDQRIATTLIDLDTDHDNKIRLMISQTKEINEDATYTLELSKFAENNSRSRMVFMNSTTTPVEDLDVQIEQRLIRIQNTLNEIDILHAAGVTVQNFIDNI